MVIGKHINEEEINKLYIEIKKGNLQARNELVTRMLGLVFFTLKLSFQEIKDYQDYAAIGSIGLIKAVEKFDPDKNVKFSSFAVKCIRNEILMALRKEKSLEKITIIAYDTPTVEDETLTIKDLLSTNESIEEEYCDKDAIKLVRQLVYSLPEREKFIIMNYYGFENLKRLNSVEIGNILGYSQSYISRILCRTQAKIKNDMIASGYNTETYTRTRKL